MLEPCPNATTVRTLRVAELGTWYRYRVPRRQKLEKRGRCSCVRTGTEYREPKAWLVAIASEAEVHGVGVVALADDVEADALALTQHAEQGPVEAARLSRTSARSSSETIRPMPVTSS